jgi:hypothetical protein
MKTATVGQEAEQKAAISTAVLFSAVAVVAQIVSIFFESTFKTGLAENSPSFDFR